MVRWVVGSILHGGVRCSSVVRVLAHGPILHGGVRCRCGKSVRSWCDSRRIDPSWGGPIGLFLVPASAPRLV